MPTQLTKLDFTVMTLLFSRFVSNRHYIRVSHVPTQTLRDVGLLRNQIGNEGLTAVIEYLPTQYTRRMLNSKDTRAKYITKVLSDQQRPFIWEFFRPGTIPLAGERAYYDEVSSPGPTSDNF